ncbi:hypothetical protein D9611_005336 [Ephemerocybe angulata]|uniref:Uncharacterized protein n=1 Tax=Ephemerocybe angulata TaxID=980116 RepID=A0A8H5FCY8_9AGAR|nr:hypothetical protein D9611_005336 [Tulosesus angulatus]
MCLAFDVDNDEDSDGGDDRAGHDTADVIQARDVDDDGLSPHLQTPSTIYRHHQHTNPTRGTRILTLFPALHPLTATAAAATTSTSDPHSTSKRILRTAEMKALVHERIAAPSSMLGIQRIPPIHVLHENDISSKPLNTDDDDNDVHIPRALAPASTTADAPPDWQRVGLFGVDGEWRKGGLNEFVMVDEMTPTSSSMLRMQRSVSNALVVRTTTNSPSSIHADSRRLTLRKNGVSKPLDIDDGDDNDAHTWYTHLRPTTEAWLLVDQRVEDGHVGVALFEIPVSRWTCLTDATSQKTTTTTTSDMPTSTEDIDDGPSTTMSKHRGQGRTVTGRKEREGDE